MYLTQEQYEKMHKEIKRRSGKSAKWDNREKINKERVLTIEECNLYCDFYLKDNMKELKEIVNQVIRKHEKEKGRDLHENEKFEFMDEAYEVFVISLGTYDPNTKCSFRTFLCGNLSRKLYSQGRDRARLRRCNWEPVIDERTKCYKYKDGKLVKKPVFDISIYSFVGDEEDSKELWEFLKARSVEDTIFNENDESDNVFIEKFINNMSRNGKKIAAYIMDGYSEDIIINEKGVTTQQYNNAINEFRMFENVHILLGGKKHGKDR